jgi:hypothetical protein
VWVPVFSLAGNFIQKAPLINISTTIEYAAITMPPVIDDVEEGDYASSEDEDFVPDGAPTAASASASASEDSESEADDATDTKRAKPTKRKRVKGQDEEAEDVGFENSGDEAIIGKGLKKQRRKKRRGEEDDEGGEGGFVRTRRTAAQA